MQYGNKKIKDVRFGSKNVVKAFYGSKLVWEKEKESLCDNYLTIEALEDGLTVSFSTNPLLYSIDNGNTWTELPADVISPVINTGQKICFKQEEGVLIPSTNYMEIGTFSISHRCNLSGNCMSLYFGDNAKGKIDMTGISFCNLFKDCDTIIEVSDNFLPATIDGNKCYNSIFSGCVNMIKAPAIQLQALSNCSKAFDNCKSLTFIKITNENLSPFIPLGTNVTGLGTGVIEEGIIYVHPKNNCPASNRLYGDDFISWKMKDIYEIPNSEIPKIQIENYDINSDGNIQINYIIDSGGSCITDLKICYNHTGSPSIEDITQLIKSPVVSKITRDSSLDYYIRVYAANKNGYCYSDEIVVPKDEEVIIPTPGGGSND
ncbi:MAG: hypothetical protein E7066_06185 [Lentimicrobiaceae bacterium]|nr:hypothetical protein [Lentimicrobiaceae bacterium]